MIAAAPGSLHRSATVRATALGLLATVLLMLAAATPAAASAGAPASTASAWSWGAPVLIDHRPPYAHHGLLNSISCPSALLCVGVDGAGDVLTSSRPAGGVRAWSQAVTLDPGHNLAQVSCAAVSPCVAVDVAGRVALVLWAGDEIIRGVNPFRRLLGAAVLVAVLVNILR